MDKDTFGTAIACVDGRVQIPVIEWICSTHHVDYVDMVTEPGADMVLARWVIDKLLSIKDRTRLSVEAHGSQVVAVVGHFDCTRAPGSRDEHFAQIKAAVAVVSSWGLKVPVIGLWVNERQKVEQVTE
ncbi:hypothetical protein LLH03_05590 [bacterium]|nr:hypothetical protein [bacterium]